MYGSFILALKTYLFAYVNIPLDKLLILTSQNLKNSPTPDQTQGHQETQP